MKKEKVEKIDRTIELRKNKKSLNSIVNSNKGITIISLVVTIIILIILSGISINLLLGDTGIITKVKNAKKEQDIVRIDEKLELEKAELAVKEYGKLDVNKYLEQIKANGIIEENDIDRINEESVNITVEGKHVFLVEKEEPNNIKIEYIGEPGNLIPKIEITSISNTTNSITINFKLRYAAKYRLLIKEEGQEYRKEKEETVSTNQISYTFNNLNQSVTYTIKIEAEAENGATAQKEETIGMDTIPTPSITVVDASTWTTSKNVTITTASGYTTKYTTDGTIPSASNGTTYTGEFTVNSNCIITAVYLDSANQIGSGATNEITKIDTTAPTSVSVSAGTVSNKTITLTGNATDEQSGIKSYKFYVDGSLKTTITTSNTSTTYSWTSTFGDHTAYIIVEDDVGRTTTSSTINFSDYTIATKAELEAFRDSVNSGNTYAGKVITQTANIDLEGSSTNKWIPIGNASKQFSGTYNGNKKSINNLYFNSGDYKYAGLFGVNSSSGTIKQVVLKNCYIYTTSKDVGGIVAYNYGKIIKCGVTGQIYSERKVTGQMQIGGIVGQNVQGEISECYTNISITTVDCTFIGGIAGINHNSGIIKNCYSIGTISNNLGDNATGHGGGISGYNGQKSEIENCYTLIDVIGEYKDCKDGYDYRGGIVALNGGYGNAAGEVINSYCSNLNTLSYIYCSDGGSSREWITIGKMKMSDMKLSTFVSTLGDAFKTDSKNINSGYPILSWQ